MKSIKALAEFKLRGVPYEEGDEVEIININEAVELNEKGFITPLSAKDLYNLKKELENPYKKVEKEEE